MLVDLAMHSRRADAVVRPSGWAQALQATLDVLLGIGAALLVSYFLFLQGLF